MRMVLVGAVLGSTLVVSAASGAQKPFELATRGPVRAIAADGDRAALVVGGRGGCASVVVWEPPSRRVVRLQSAARCESQGASLREGTDSVALAGTRAAWVRTAGGNALETWLHTATLVHTAPVVLAMAAAIGDGGYGWYIRRPVGDGTLIAFTLERRCDAYNPGESQCPPGRKHGSVVEATVMSVGKGGPGSCSNPVRRIDACRRVAREDGELTVLAVDAGRIVVRSEDGIRVLTQAGDVVRELDVKALTAALSGKRLAVRTPSAIELYDVGSGRLVAELPAASGLRLEDLERDLLVTASGGTVRLRRLRDARTISVRAGGVARGQLESAGLFVSGARRVTFTPMRDVLRRLGD